MYKNAQQSEVILTRENPPTSPHHESISEEEEKAFELITADYNERAIQMNDFYNIPGYWPLRIRDDKERVTKKKKEIQETNTEPTKAAKLLEAILVEQIELSNWFGENTYTIIPSEYGDLFHGIDLALQIEDEAQGVKHLAMGIDVTTSPIAIRKKLSIIKKHIRTGTLTMMEYFHSDDYDPDFYGAMTHIPQVVVGTERKTMRELSDLWLKGYRRAKINKKTAQPPLSPEGEASQRDQAKETKDKLGKHRIQLLLLEEIKMQLTVFHEFALQSRQNQAAEKLASVLSLVESILRTRKTPTPDDVFKNSEDDVFQALRYALDDFDNL